MNKMVGITFRVEESLKKDLEKVCKDLGISMSAAFTIFAKKMVREQRIPFDVSVENTLHVAGEHGYKVQVLDLRRPEASDTFAPPHDVNGDKSK